MLMFFRKGKVLVISPGMRTLYVSGRRVSGM